MHIIETALQLDRRKHQRTT